ncbi:MAG TPA: siphovirus Gp157 family protein [Rubricoccaceae bacterium]|nr:siphovirus Gp157 family protein [Rubricoccaceae bacterium]
MITPLSLYELDDELLRLEEELLAAAGEVDDETDARHAALLDARDDKIEAYVAMIRRFEVSAEAVKAERKRLHDCERALDASAKRLRDRLCRSMAEHAEREHATRLGTVRLMRASSPPVEVLVEVDTLPEPFCRKKVEADLAALRAALLSDDEAVRAMAEACARLGEPSLYLRFL